MADLRATATLNLQDLAEKNILISTGGGRSTHYKVNLQLSSSSLPTARYMTDYRQVRIQTDIEQNMKLTREFFRWTFGNL